MRTLVVLICLAACTTFEPIERNVCGNGLLEPGEDCDSPDPKCVACAVACSTGSDCPNAAYTCGVDGLCHAPSGLFAQPTPQVLALVDEMQIADIDRDGIGDVLGVSSTQLDVRFGDPTASLATDSSLATSQQTATVAFGDVDGDGVTDATIVTQDGIVTFTSPYGALTAAPSQLPIGSNAQLLASFPIGSLAFGVILAGSATPILDIAQLTSSGETSAYDVDCLVPVGDVATSTIDSYTVTLGSDGSTDTLVAIYAKGGTSWCVESIHIALNGTVNGIDVTPPGAPPVRRPALAELDSATCPSLVAGTGSASVLDFAGSLVLGSPSHCELATTGTQLAAPSATDAIPVGHIPLTPAIAGYASDLLVLQNGVYGMQTGLTEIFKSGPTIRRRRAAISTATARSTPRCSRAHRPIFRSSIASRTRRSARRRSSRRPCRRPAPSGSPRSPTSTAMAWPISRTPNSYSITRSCRSRSASPATTSRRSSRARSRRCTGSRRSASPTRAIRNR